MLREVLAEAYVYDLAETGAAEVPLRDSEALLNNAGLRPPHLTDWKTACEYVTDYLDARRVIQDSELSLRIVKDAEDLARRVPLAAVVPVMVAVAEWEGTAGSWLIRDAEGAQNWGWHGLVLPLARVFAQSDLLWAGRELVDRALGTVRRAEGRRMPAHTAAAIAGLVKVGDELERRYIDQRDELAWALWTSCRASGAAVRAPLAALLWTLGDPWAAHALADGTLVPSRRQLEGALDVALRRAPLDPMLAAVCARLWGVPGVEMIDREAMYRRLSRRWMATPAAQALEEMTRVFGVSPSASYGRALVNWFRSASTDEERETIRFLQPFVESVSHTVSVRFTSLSLLLDEDQAGVQGKWWRLAEKARSVVAEENWQARADPYDKSMDLPLYYLEGAEDECFGAIEEQRRASMEFVLWNIPPPKPSALEAQSLLAEEQNLLEEIRLLRYVSQLPRLPLWAGQAYKIYLTADEFGQEVTAAWADLDRAQAGLVEDRRKLNALANELAEFAPNYAESRRDPQGSLRDFAAALAGEESDGGA